MTASQGIQVLKHSRLLNQLPRNNDMPSPFLGTMRYMKEAGDTTPSLKLFQTTQISKHIKHLGNVCLWNAMIYTYTKTTWNFRTGKRKV